MKFKTESGSVYEVDTTNKLVRRLEGTANPTPRQGKDGEWKSYLDITGPKVGVSCVVFWDPATTPPLTDLGGVPITYTSSVVEIIDDAIQN